MAKSKKAVPAAGTVGNGEQLRFPGKEFTVTPVKDYNPKSGTIASLLKKGRENGITANQLAEMTGTEYRSITLRIQRERRNGAPILSDTTHGYWLAESADELRRCASALHKRATEIRKTAKALEAKADAET